MRILISKFHLEIWHCFRTAHITSFCIVIVNVKCQLDCTKGCPDSWQSIISGCVCEGVSEIY